MEKLNKIIMIIVKINFNRHIYSKPLSEIISACERNGWELVRGGFIDRGRWGRGAY